MSKILFFIGKLFPRNQISYYINRCLSWIFSGYCSKQFRSSQYFSISFPANVIRGHENISIGNKTGIGKHLTLTSWEGGEINIGNDCSIGDYAHISSSNNIIIGNNVLIGKFVTINDNSHGNSSSGHPAERKLYSKGKVIIEDDVWIGDKVTILSNVHIGRGAVIGANSVVTKNVTSNSIYAGNPAIFIKSI